MQGSNQQYAGSFNLFWNAIQSNQPVDKSRDQAVGAGYGDIYKQRSHHVPEEEMWANSVNHASPLQSDPIWVRKKRQFWSCKSGFSIWKTPIFKVWVLCVIIGIFSVYRLNSMAWHDPVMKKEVVDDAVLYVENNFPLKIAPVIVEEFASHTGWYSDHGAAEVADKNEPTQQNVFVMPDGTEVKQSFW